MIAKIGSANVTMVAIGFSVSYNFLIRSNYNGTNLIKNIIQGGFIPSCDHQTPPGVSLEDYNLYTALLGEYCRMI